MFNWFSAGSKTAEAGLEKMQAGLCGMLDSSHRAFEMASDAFLGEESPEAIRRELFKIDKSINRAERDIRQQIVVHATVHGAVEFPPCLVLMSVAKDAERLGDYGKNLFDLAELTTRHPEGEHRENFVQLKGQILSLIKECNRAIEARDKEGATRVIVSAKGIEDLCDAQISNLVRGPVNDEMVATYALAYRYNKRIASHCRNIASSVVQPLHKIDFTSKIVSGSE